MVAVIYEIVPPVRTRNILFEKKEKRNEETRASARFSFNLRLKSPLERTFLPSGPIVTGGEKCVKFAINQVNEEQIAKNKAA
jgi:hypothetical protein